MKFGIKTFSNRYSILLEVFIGLVTFAFLIYTARSMFLFGDTIFIHDASLFQYQLFQYFAENLINGHFPLWNPFTHGGEPFYPALGLVRFLEPLVFLTIYLGQYFTHEIPLLFNWSYLAQILFMLFGVYLVFRSLTEHYFIRFTLIPILVYSSFLLAPLRAFSTLRIFMYVPYMAYFLLRILYYRDTRWHNWLLLAVCIGFHWQGYWFIGPWTFLLFFFLGVFFFRRDLLKKLLKTKRVVAKLAVLSVIILVMMVLDIIQLLEKEKFIYPPRMVEVHYKEQQPIYGPIQYEGGPANLVEGVNMQYSIIAYTGTFSTIWDFIQLLSPDGNKFLLSHKAEWGSPSEAYMYIGVLPWAIALLGIVAGKHDLKKVWLLILSAFGLLMLGPPGGLHRILYYIYPPLRFIRHTHFFVLFFLFSVVYFYILGCNYIFSTWSITLFPPNRKAKKAFVKCITGRLPIKHLHVIISVIIFAGSIVGVVYWMTKLTYPEDTLLFLLIIPIVALGWLFHKNLGEKVIYISLIGSHSILILIFHPDRFHFVIRMLLFLGFPCILFLVIKTRRNLSRKVSVSLVLCVVVAGSLLLDLGTHLKLAAGLYRGQESPRKAFNLDTTVREPVFVHQRQIVPETFYTVTGQALRYVSIAQRQPYVFSSIMQENPFKEDTTEGETTEFARALHAKRWSSFFLPKHYFELIHSGISPEVLQEVFAVGKPVFQFKQGVIGIARHDLSPFLNNIDSKEAVRLLEDYILVDDTEIDSSLSRFTRSSTAYEKMVLRDAPAQETRFNNQHFFYEIEEYNYNSISMKVSADREGLLYWSDGYDIGWHAYINGREVSVYRANVNFKAIVLPKGVNHISFKYKHHLFTTALLIFYGSSVFSVTLALSMCFLSHISMRY